MGEKILTKHDRHDTLHYVDPPYVHKTRGNNKKHSYMHEMSDADHEALADCLHGLEGMVVLSGYHSPLYDRLYQDWYTTEIDAHADGALDRTEVLWINPRAAGLLPQPDLFVHNKAPVLATS